MSEKFTKTHTFDADKTCKARWTFTLSKDGDGLIIEDLKIEPHLTQRGTQRGCWGHPQSIVALLQGARVDAINIRALSEAACARDVSCGQTLARCLEDLRAHV